MRGKLPQAKTDKPSCQCPRFSDQLILKSSSTSANLGPISMKILLTSYGSTGDIFPVIALGAACIRKGHEVAFATSPLYRSEIERAGLRYVYLPPDWEQWQYNDAMLKLTRARTPIETLQIIYRHSLPYLDEIVSILDREIAQADLVVSSYLVPYYRTLAERQGKPFAVVTFTPNVVPCASVPPPHPLAMIPLPRFIRPAWNRLSWRIAGIAVDSAINRVIGKPLRKIGIPKFKNWLLHPADCALVSVSPALFQPPGEIPNIFRFVGYMRWQTYPDPEVLQKVSDFCKGKKVPVITFGSVTFKDREKVMERFLRNWPSDRQLIIQKGWVDLDAPSNQTNLCVVGSVSHDALFKHASVVIHHGGAGTTSSCLHAGIPQIVIPHIGDQWFWGREVKRLGVGTSISRSRWPERLCSVLDHISSHDGFRNRADQVRQTLEVEDGAIQAVAELEAYAVRSHHLITERPGKS